MTPDGLAALSDAPTRHSLHESYNPGLTLSLHYFLSLLHLSLYYCYRLPNFPYHHLLASVLNRSLIYSPPLSFPHPNPFSSSLLYMCASRRGRHLRVAVTPFFPTHHPLSVLPVLLLHLTRSVDLTICIPYLPPTTSQYRTPTSSHPNPIALQYIQRCAQSTFYLIT